MATLRGLTIIAARVIVQTDWRAVARRAGVDACIAFGVAVTRRRKP